MTRPPDFQLLEPGPPSGIGGWLLLPLVGLVLTALSAAKNLVVDTLTSLRPEIWGQLTSPDSAVDSNFWAPYVIVSGLINLVTATGAGVLLVLFLKRKKEVPLLISLLYGWAVAMAIFEAFSLGHLASQLPELFEANELASTTRAVVRSLVVACVWVTYFKLSKRVRNTFVV